MHSTMTTASQPRGLRRAMQSGWSVVVASAMVVTGVLKLATGYSSVLWTGITTYYVIAVVEVVVGFGIILAGRHRAFMLAGTALALATSSVWTYWSSSRPCGCLGSRWLLTNASRSALSAVLSIVALLALSRQTRGIAFGCPRPNGRRGYSEG